MRPVGMVWASLVLLALALASPSSRGLPPRGQGAKAVFFDPDKGAFVPRKKKPRRRPEPPSPVPVRPSDPPVPEEHPLEAALGLRYWIKLLDAEGHDGVKVTDGWTFRSGDRIQLFVESNSDAYLFLAQVDADGEGQVIFPGKNYREHSGQVRAHEPQTLPGIRHFLRFDEKPGTERLLILLARERSLLEPLLRSDRVAPQLIQDLTRAARELRGSKTLLVEEFEDPGPEASTYAVELSGNSVLFELFLIHR